MQKRFWQALLLSRTSGAFNLMTVQCLPEEGKVSHAAQAKSCICHVLFVSPILGGTRQTRHTSANEQRTLQRIESAFGLTPSLSQVLTNDTHNPKLICMAEGRWPRHFQILRRYKRYKVVSVEKRSHKFRLLKEGTSSADSIKAWTNIELRLFRNISLEPAMNL